MKEYQKEVLRILAAFLLTLLLLSLIHRVQELRQNDKDSTVQETVHE